MNADDGRGVMPWIDRAIAGLPPTLKAPVSLAWQRFQQADRKTRAMVLGGAGVGVLALFWIGSGGDSPTGGVTFTVQRGDLVISVLEGGALEAMQSQEIRSAVRGREGAKILSIVEEGYRITPEDVAAGKILVELDTSSLIEQQLNQEIAVETAEAAFIERKAQYDIQLNTNVTDLNSARQTMKFARLDFEKFLGAAVVNRILGDLGIEERLARAEAADRASLASLTAELNGAARPAVVVRNEDQRQADSRPDTEGVAQEALTEADIEALPAPFQARIREAMAANGGQLPAEMLARIQQGRAGGGAGGGFPGGGRRARPPAADADPEAEAAPTDTVGDSPRFTTEPVELTLSTADAATVPGTVTALMDASYMTIRDRIDFSIYADLEVLEDGEAKQQLRGLVDDVQVAEEEYLLAQDRIEGQRRLAERNFITPTELEAEELKIDKAINRQQETQTALLLYKQYTFPKDAEKLLADYENAVMAYLRTSKENIAEEAQEQARLKSAESKYKLELEKLNDINEQIAAATIRATRPGLVVYGGANQNPMRRGSQEAIQEGATVSERQSILTIPDMREMAVKVNIHESAVKRLATGQQVRVKIDAFPNQQLTGEVIRVAVVADSASSFMNPDLKVYPTVVKIHGTYDWLRPGMSAEVEILVDTLEGVIYVPLQAVSYVGEQQVVFVKSGSRVEQRVVEVGDFSEQFIEIVSGLQAGEEVLLLPPPELARAG